MIERRARLYTNKASRLLASTAEAVFGLQRQARAASLATRQAGATFEAEVALHAHNGGIARWARHHLSAVSARAKALRWGGGIFT